MEPPAIGSKTKMMAQKVSMKLWKMFFGSTMMLNTHGIKEGSREDKPDEAEVKEREKEKAEEVEDTSSQEDPKAEAKEEEKAALTWWEKKDMKKIGKKKKTGMIPGMKAIGPMIQAGMMAIGPQELYYKDEYGYFQKKGKGKKGKKGKDGEGKGKPGDGKGKSNYSQPQTSSTPAIQNQQQQRRRRRRRRRRRQQQQQQQQQQQAHYYTAASRSGHGFVSFVETGPERVDVLTANYEEQEYHRRTRRGGQHQREPVAQQNREAKKRFPVLVGEVDALQHGFQRRPHPVPREVGLQPEKGT